MGTDYWKGMMGWIKDRMLSEGCIKAEDLALIQLTDDPEEVANGIERHYQRDRAEKISNQLTLT